MNVPQHSDLSVVEGPSSATLRFAFIQHGQDAAINGVDILEGKDDRGVSASWITLHCNRCAETRQFDIFQSLVFGIGESPEEVRKIDVRLATSFPDDADYIHDCTDELAHVPDE